MPDIFLSYAREDEARAAKLAYALEAQGWDVFWDREIPSGATWRSHIGEALGSARAVIVAWSAAALESDWVTEEADDARMRDALFPVLFEAVVPPLGFRSVQAADLTDWRGDTDDEAFLRFVGDLALRLGPPPGVERPAGSAAGEGDEALERAPDEPSEESTDRGSPAGTPPGEAGEAEAAAATPALPPGDARRGGRPGWLIPSGLALFALIGVVLALQWRSGLGSGPAAPPTIDAFEANLARTVPGGTVSLKWSTRDADRVELRPGGTVRPADVLDVTPSETTAYVLTAHGPGGVATDSVVVEVAPEVGEGPTADPIAAALVVEPATARAGSVVTLRWDTKSAPNVRIEPGVGDVPASGSRRVRVVEDVTYTLTASRASESITRRATVTVARTGADLIASGGAVSLRLVSRPEAYVRHDAPRAYLDLPVSSADSMSSTFRIVPGLADRTKVSLQSVNVRDGYLRHAAEADRDRFYRMELARNDESRAFAASATFDVYESPSGAGFVFESVDRPKHLIRSWSNLLVIDIGDGSPDLIQDASFDIVEPLASVR